MLSYNPHDIFCKPTDLADARLEKRLKIKKIRAVGY